MSGKIFINYRRGDAPDSTGRLYDRLESEFATADLFMDVEGHIKPGDDFVEVLGLQVAQCDVLLAVIGPNWSDLLAARNNDPEDFVAVEIKAALEQKKRVIPVLVGGAAIPRADTLPEEIRPLVRRNAVALRPERFKVDCQGLIGALKELLAAATQERATRTQAEREAAEAERKKREEEESARISAAEERERKKREEGLSYEQIRQGEEFANWELVKESKNPQDFRDHVARFFGGPTERQAIGALEKLVWSSISSPPTDEQLTAYLDEFPRGYNAYLARGQLQERKDAIDKKLRAEALTAQETKEWGVVASSTEKSTIEAFLIDWPGSQHADAARARLNELRATRGILPAITWLFLALITAFTMGFWFEEKSWTVFDNVLNGELLSGWSVGSILAVGSGISMLRLRRPPLKSAECAIYWMGCTLVVAALCAPFFDILGLIAYPTSLHVGIGIFAASTIALALSWRRAK